MEVLRDYVIANFICRSRHASSFSLFALSLQIHKSNSANLRDLCV